MGRETRRCEKCGEEADFVAGINTFDRKLNQFHCPKCHFTFICVGFGKFLREGVLPEPQLLGVIKNGIQSKTL